MGFTREREGFRKKKLASAPAGSMRNEPTEGNEEQFPNEAMGIAERVHRPSTNAGRRLAVRHRDWTSGGIGEAIYMYTLWIMRWKGNGPMGSKINRRSQVEAELDIPTGDRGGGNGKQYLSHNGGWR